jgi:hypothetical protein
VVGPGGKSAASAAGSAGLRGLQHGLNRAHIAGHLFLGAGVEIERAGRVIQAADAIGTAKPAGNDFIILLHS